MNTMHGDACFACSNRSRTRDAPTPTNISTKSEPEMEKKGTPASPATARASSVLPVPGGRVMDRRLLPVVVLEVELLLVRVEDDLLDRAARVVLRVALEDLVVDLRVRVLLALAAVPAEGLQRQPDEGRDDHEREKGA